jgi:NADPH-dependent curcumin reductase CurA
MTACARAILEVHHNFFASHAAHRAEIYAPLPDVYRGPFEAGKPMSGGGICLVKASKSSSFKEGDVVSGFVQWSTYYVADEATLVSRVVLCVHFPHAVTAVLAGAGDLLSSATCARMHSLAHMHRILAFIVSCAVGASLM